jgi:hypothetical protein
LNDLLSSIFVPREKLANPIPDLLAAECADSEHDDGIKDCS